MTTASHQPGRSTLTASLWSISITVILAAITHAYEFGIVAFAVAAVVIAVLLALGAHYRRTGNRPALVLYGLLNL